MKRVTKSQRNCYLISLLSFAGLALSLDSKKVNSGPKESYSFLNLGSYSNFLIKSLFDGLGIYIISPIE